jgi:archaemetzincin
MKPLVTLMLCVALISCTSPDSSISNISSAPALDQRASKLSKQKDSLVKFFRPMSVQEGDWLESQVENGETFEEYVASNPTLPTESRKTIYIQPIGTFTREQAKVIGLTADYMRAFYNLPVVLRDAMPLAKVPPDMTRTQYRNNRQVRTSYFLDDLLPRLLPADAAAFISLTSADLYPGDTWNYVFGQASLEKRVGVWSLWRLQKENGKQAPSDVFLDRTLKVSMHETGHMFSMRHCTKYECLMSGTNHLGETDRRPLDSCPECTMKIAWAMKYRPIDRYKKLAEFWRKQGRKGEEKELLGKANALEGSR